MTTLDEKTKIPIKSAIIIIVTLIPIIVWALKVESNAQKGANAEALYLKIDRRLERIEIKLGTKPKNDILEVSE
jgi:hypothetical protein